MENEVAAQINPYIAFLLQLPLAGMFYFFWDRERKEKSKVQEEKETLQKQLLEAYTKQTEVQVGLKENADYTREVLKETKDVVATTGESMRTLAGKIDQILRK